MKAAGFIATVCRAGFVGLVALCLLQPAAAADLDSPVVLHRDNALGTSLDVTVFGADAAAARAAFAQLEAELARLDSVLSRYRKDSELVQFNRSGRADSPSPALREVYRLCEDWWARSETRFSCRMGAVIDAWEQAEQTQQAPERIALRDLAWRANRASLASSGDHLTLPTPVQLAPDGLAKGYVIDQLARTLSAALPRAAFKLDIGGDAVYVGTPPGREGWDVAVADPVNTADNGNFITRLQLSSRAIAASGHHSRARQIGRRSYSHILKPRDGWPVTDAPAAVVVAPDAVTADAVATALSVSQMAEGIDWVNTLAGVEALVISAQGRQLASANWHELVGPTAANAAPVEASMHLRYELPSFEVAEYHPPYLSVWISNPRQQIVRNLLLLGETERWARENRRWWRKSGRNDPGLLDGIARPTRSPGVYDLVWDGLNDFGEAVPAGEYVLNLEASRETGGSSYRKIPFVLGGPPLDVITEAEGELGRVEVHVAGNANTNGP
ncbi:DUF2271 domain-containing protein [Parahaliea mediterranea]|uniref:DUF2271 domain-containing protein n=1 Tax=Parahaliea mediterranea TaxID=651086 RepID=UPI000E2FE664|nr:DUF2271 domain-containing protein [Parahaliea mediterranea]